MSIPWSLYNRKKPPVRKSPPGAGRWGHDAWMFVVKSNPGLAQDVAYLAGFTRDLGMDPDEHLVLRPNPERA